MVAQPVPTSSDRASHGRGDAAKNRVSRRNADLRIHHPRHPALPVHRGPDRRRRDHVADRPSTTTRCSRPASTCGWARAAWRVRASFLPGRPHGRASGIADVAMHELDLTRRRRAGARLRLHRRAAGAAGAARRASRPAPIPKSSTGRVDVFVRLLTDRGAAFDDVAEGYDGPLYIEIAPQTFSVLVRSGTRLNQLRLQAPASRRALRDPQRRRRPRPASIAGFRARRHAGRHRPRPGGRPRPARLLGAAGAPPRRAAARSRRVLHPGLQGGGRDPGAGRPPR